MSVLLVIVGAALGAPLRYLTDRAVHRRVGGRGPWGILLVNVAGSLLLGFLAASATAASASVQAFVGAGFCGALTTYSTFGYDTVRLAQGRAGRLALLNVVLTLACGLSAAFAGAGLAALIFD